MEILFLNKIQKLVVKVLFILCFLDLRLVFVNVHVLVCIPDNLPVTDQVRSTEDWHQKFADKFTDIVVATDTSYTSPNLSIQLSYNSYDTGKLDYSNFGKHLKYGTKTSYVLADIYVGDISQLKTAFAQDTYGVGYTEKLSDMSDRMKSVLAVNGDSYSNDRHKDNGTIIRNSVIYRSQQSAAETCVLSKKAYNLDGGHCSFMTFNGTTANHPYKPEHEISDGIFITE